MCRKMECVSNGNVKEACNQPCDMVTHAHAHGHAATRARIDMYRHRTNNLERYDCILLVLLSHFVWMMSSHGRKVVRT